MTADAPRADPAFQFLQSIASDLASKRISFPTFADATFRIRRAADDPATDTETLSRVVSADPLVSARVVQMANAAAFGPLPKPIGDVKTAIARIGYTMVKSVAVAVSLQQLLSSKESRAFPKRAEAAWRHSIAVAALANLLARKLTRQNPDEALFAGLVHDIGYFYLLSRAPRFPGIDATPGVLDGILEEWHGPIGASVLHSFSLSDATLEAVAEHENGVGAFPMRTLGDVVKTANALTASTNPIHLVRHAIPPPPAVDASITELVAASQAELRALEADLSK